MFQLAFASAAGTTVPPVFIFQGQRLGQDYLQDNGIPDAKCTVTPSGIRNVFYFFIY
jgi:hypothetical protein